MNFLSEKKNYRNNFPFSHIYFEDFLEEKEAYLLRECIQNIPEEKFDSYNNPFENKKTLRNKFNLPPLLENFFTKLNTKLFRKCVSKLTGINGLLEDEHRHYWGVHIAENGAFLEQHLDAKIHPKSDLEKRVTLLVYLPTEGWKKEYGGELELWDREVSRIEKSIPVEFNSCVVFTNTEKSFYGFSRVSAPEGQKRMLVTVSYMTQKRDNIPERYRALFVEKKGVED